MKAALVFVIAWLFVGGTFWLLLRLQRALGEGCAGSGICRMPAESGGVVEHSRRDGATDA